MRVLLKRQPQIAIASIASYIETKNTPGSGERFIVKFRKFIQESAKEKVKYALCNYAVLASFNYSCLIFNKWVIAFSIEKNVMTIHTIIHGSLLK